MQCKELEMKLRLLAQRNDELVNETRSRMRVSSVTASKYPIYRIFTQPSTVWIAELHRGQAAAYRRLRDAGSRQELPPLIGSAGKVDVPPGKTVVQLDQAAFCGFFRQLLSDDDAVALLARRVKVVRDPTAPADEVNIAVNELSATLRLPQKPIVVIVCGHEKSGAPSSLSVFPSLPFSFLLSSSLIRP